MGEIVHLHTSQPTLEQIAEKDGVDEKHRKRFMRNHIMGDIALSGISLGLAGVGINKMVEAGEVSFWYGALSTVTGLLGFAGVASLIQDIMTTRGYFQQLRLGIKFPKGFFYLDGPISREKTAVEIQYGHEISPTVIPSKIGKTKDLSDGNYQFIDHVIIKGVSQTEYDEETFEYDADGGQNRIVTNFHDVSFWMQRYNRSERFSFKFKKYIDSDISKLINLQDEELALVIDPRPTQYSYQKKGIEVKALYKQADLERHI